MVIRRCFESAVLPFAVILTVWGCGERRDQIGVERVRVGDTLFVHSHRPEYADTIPMVEVLRIGTVDGPEEYMFSNVRSFAVGPAGDLFVNDYRDGIRHYSPEGIFLSWLARQGEGPREIELAAAMDVSPSGVVAAEDVGNARISIFHLGDSVALVPRPEGKPAWSDEDALLFHTDGTLWVKLNPWWPPPEGITHPRAIYARVDVAGQALVDTVFTPANAAEECPTLTEHPFSQGVWQDTRERWVPKTMWSWGLNGTFALGCPATYQFTITKPTGETLKISRDWTPVHEPEEALRFHEKWGGMGDVPPTLPAYSQIILPEDARIWVWPTQPSEPVSAPPAVTEMTGVTVRWWTGTKGAFDVFSPDGHWIGVVKPPDGVEYNGFPTRDAVVIRGDTMWAVAKDSLDVEYIVRCEVVWPGSMP